VGSMKQRLIDSLHHSNQFVDSVKEQGNYFAKESFLNGKDLFAAVEGGENLKKKSIHFATLGYSMYYSHFTLTAPIFKSRFQSSTYLQEEAYGTRK
jgi:hypothetical protein